MSMADDYDIDPPEADMYNEESDRIGIVKTINRDEMKVTERDYCLNCKSLNIKTSKKGNKYCADLCWTNNNK